MPAKKKPTKKKAAVRKRRRTEARSARDRVEKSEKDTLLRRLAAIEARLNELVGEEKKALVALSERAAVETLQKTVAELRQEASQATEAYRIRNVELHHITELVTDAAARLQIKPRHTTHAMIKDIIAVAMRTPLAIVHRGDPKRPLPKSRKRRQKARVQQKPSDNGIAKIKTGVWSQLRRTVFGK